MAQVDQIEFQPAKTQWMEGSAFPLPVYLRLRSTAAASTPTSIKYRIDCLSTQEQIADWATVSAASNFTISITGTHNAIRDDSNDYEIKQVTVMTDDGLSTQHRGVFRWRVLNLYGTT